MRKSLKISLNRIFVSLFLILYTFVPSVGAVDTIIEDYSTEDITLSNVNDEITEEDIVTEVEAVEVIVEEEVLPIWTESGSSATTTAVVGLGEVYTAPQNSDVSLTFTKLPEGSGYLTINEILLTQEEVEATGAVSDIAYDITTDMLDGTYEYNLTLPTTSDDVNVVYAEERDEILSNTQEVNETLIVKDGVVEIEGLDHFTVYIVVDPNPAGNGNPSADDCQTVGVIGDPVCYDTIQGAVTNAVSGDTIYIRAGTHVISSQLVINKDLEIIGTGVGSTIIVPGFNTGSSGDTRALVLINNDAQVMISDLTVDGSGFNVYQAFRINDADYVDFNNISFENISYGHPYLGFAVAYMNTDGDINNVSLMNIQRVGFSIYYTSNVNINGFSYTGKGDGDWLDYAIEVGGGGHLILNNADISNCTGVASSDGSGSAGILASTFYGAGTAAEIENTTLTNNSVGLYVGYNTADTSIVEIHNSDFEGNDYGVVSMNPQVDATYNWWGDTDNSGPYDEWIDGSTPETNIGGTGDHVYGAVNYSNWIQFDLVPPSVPVLQSPIGGALINDNTPLMQWDDSIDNGPLDTGIKGYYYRIYYNCSDINDPNTCTSLYPNTTGLWRTTSEYQAGTTPDGTYYWQVKAVDNSDNESDWSNLEMVTIDTEGPSAPEILLPSPESFFNTTPILNDWTDVTDPSGITNYRIEYVYDDDGHTFSGAPYRTTTLSQRNHSPAGWEQGGVSFRVQAFDNAGNEGDWSEWRHYTYDSTSPTTPELLFPVDNQILNAQDLYIDWAESTDNITQPSDMTYEYRLYTKDPNIFPGASYFGVTYTGTTRHPATGFASGTGEHEYWYMVQAIDQAGNESGFSSPKNFIVDNTNPTGSIDGIKYPNGTIQDKFITNLNTPIIVGSADDENGVKSVDVEIGGHSSTSGAGGPGFWEAGFSNPIPDGTYTIKLTIEDLAGNIAVITEDITIDTVAPTATHKYFRNGVEIVDSVAYVRGVNELTFTGEYFDQLPSSDLYRDSFVIFEAQDDGSFRFSANGKKSFCGWRNYPNMIDLTTYSGETYNFTDCIDTLPDGNYYMAHHIYDSATRKDIPSINQFRDVLGLNFIVDSTKPSLSITFPSEGDILGTQFTLNGTAQDLSSGLNQIRVRFRDSDTNTLVKTCFATVQNNWSLDIGDGNCDVPDGKYKIVVRARDEVGNTRFKNVKDITIDSVAPVIAGHADMVLVEGDPFPTDTVTLTDDIALDKVSVRATDTTGSLGFASDNATVIEPLAGDQFPLADEIRKNIESWQSAPFTTIDLNVLPAGTYLIEYYATDMAGNMSNLESFTVTIVDNTPTVSISSSVLGLTVGSTTTLTANVTDGNLPFTYVWGGACIGTTPSTIFTAVAEGDYICTVLVTDDDGDIASDTYTVTVGAALGATDDASGSTGTTDTKTPPAQQSSTTNEFYGTGGGNYLYALNIEGERDSDTEEDKKEDEDVEEKDEDKKDKEEVKGTKDEEKEDEKTNWLKYLLLSLPVFILLLLILRKRKKEEEQQQY